MGILTKNRFFCVQRDLLLLLLSLSFAGVIRNLIPTFRKFVSLCNFCYLTYLRRKCRKWHKTSERSRLEEQVGCDVCCILLNACVLQSEVGESLCLLNFAWSGCVFETVLLLYHLLVSTFATEKMIWVPSASSPQRKQQQKKRQTMCV